MEHPEKNEKITAKGILLPSDWDDNGAVLGLTLFTHDEDEYGVTGKDITPRLLEVLRQELVIEGYLQWEKGRKMILITAFSPFGMQ